ncbi:hypothetical protein PG984_009838 [Apiospora sp. TS-2023a]
MASDSHHRDITKDSSPEDWHGNCHRVSRIQEVHASYLETMLPSLSTRQNQARVVIVAMLTEYAIPQNADATIDWNRDVNQIYEHLDALFFRGLLKRSNRVRLHAKPTGLDASSDEDLHLGVTHYGQDNGQIDIHFDTQEVGVAKVKTRLQKRSRVLGIICHELIHAFLDVYGCHCREVCNTRDGGEWKLLIEDNKHSDAWTAIATRVNRLFVKLFDGRLEYVQGVQWFSPVKAEGQDDLQTELVVDALSIYDTAEEDTQDTMQIYKTDDPIQARVWAEE